MMMMALPSAFMLRMHREELVGLLGGQHGGGLVQDQDVRAAVEHLDDLHRLLLADTTSRRSFWSGSMSKPYFSQMARTLALRPLSGRACRRPMAQDDVFGGGEHIHQLEVLVDHADAQIEAHPWGSGWSQRLPST